MSRLEHVDQHIHPLRLFQHVRTLGREQEIQGLLRLLSPTETFYSLAETRIGQDEMHVVTSPGLNSECFTLLRLT